jgi:uncharacterized protein (TIGR03089 family)
MMRARPGTSAHALSPDEADVTPADLLRDALHRNAAAPLLTAYDDATDERVELSGATFANWVAKTANLLQDEFDIGPGRSVAVALPVHWQTAAVLLGIWSCGATVLDTAAEDEGRLTGIDLVLAAQDRLPAIEEEGGDTELLGLSLHPLGMGMRDYAGPARDFAVEVRMHGDAFFPYQDPDPAAPGLVVGGLELTLGGLTDAAAELAGRLGLVAGDRVLVDEPTALEAGPVAWLLAPLSAGASIVLCRHARTDRLADRAAAERVTATLGCRVDGVRELGRGA